MQTPPLLWQFEHSLECKASKSFVWSFWSDVSNWERLEGNAVEWIRLEGPFETGSQGTTKVAGQEPRYWTIAHCEPGESGTIEAEIGLTTFYTRLQLSALSDDLTLLTQRMWLEGEANSELVAGMKMFEENAPAGLKKMVEVIEGFV